MQNMGGGSLWAVLSCCACIATCPKAKLRRHLKPKLRPDPCDILHPASTSPRWTTKHSSRPNMCGIFCSLSRNGFITPDAPTNTLLQNRGPDSIGLHQSVIGAPPVHATFLSTVLSLRGTAIAHQPLTDESTKSVLCWNGEAWSIRGRAVLHNDSTAVFAALLVASAAETASKADIIDVLSSIRGPYAFVFYDAPHKRIYYGRDCLGRRSLLIKSTADDALILSSVCDNTPGHAWTEVEADGIYVVDFDVVDPDQKLPSPSLIPHRRSNDPVPGLSFVCKSHAVRYSLIAVDSSISCYESRPSLITS